MKMQMKQRPAFGCSVKEIAMFLKLSPERVRQLAKAGWFDIEADGTIDLSTAVIGYERSLWYGKGAALDQW
jgi:hypothetical protein